MKTYGLIGYPLAQSFSQKYFTDKFKRETIDARYLNFEIKSINDLPLVLDRHPYIAGFSVTIPHKEGVFAYLDELDESARLIGAANVIKVNWENKKPILKGFNTDLIGFTKSIKPLLKPHHKKALILGTGGAAKAIAHAFDMMNIEHKYVSRQTSLSESYSYSDLDETIIREYNIIVNCTPLGMYPKVDTCPAIPYHLITKNHLLYDLTYNPETTLFMQKGIDNGAVGKNGLEMLHQQAEAAWDIWNTTD